MNNNRLYFPNGFEKTEVRWGKIKIKLAPNGSGICAARLQMIITAHQVYRVAQIPC